MKARRPLPNLSSKKYGHTSDNNSKTTCPHAHISNISPTHHLPHELAHAAVGIAQVQIRVFVRPLVACLPQGQGTSEHSGGINITFRGFGGHGGSMPRLPGQVSLTRQVPKQEHEDCCFHCRLLDCILRLWNLRLLQLPAQHHSRVLGMAHRSPSSWLHPPTWSLRNWPAIPSSLYFRRKEMHGYPKSFSFKTASLA